MLFKNINNTMMFSIVSFAYLIIFTLVFMRNKKIQSSELKVFQNILISNILCLFIEILIVVFIINDFPLINLILKLFNVALYTYVWLFGLYTYNVSTKEKKNPLLKKSAYVWYFLTIGLLLVLKVYLNDEAYSQYSYGPSIKFLYLSIVIVIIFMVTTLIKNSKNLVKRKVLPIALLISLLTINAIVQYFNPDLLLVNTFFTLITFVMYFTIENPDIKMLEELYKNRKIIESNNESMSNFLFKISQDIRKPVKDIITLSEDSKNKNMLEINNIGKHLEYIIDDALDLSNMSTKKIKLYEDKYNATNLFKEIKTKAENEIGSKNIKIEYKISNSIPEYVYGDSVRVKQILTGIINNAIEHTEAGYITIEVNTIVKYDICRFIIDISDTGNGISLDKVNDILNLKEIEEEIDLDSNTNNLKIIKILVNKLNGNFMIKTDDNKGTTVSITIDQKIVESSESEMSKKLDLYEESLHNNKKIMVVDSDIKELNKITRFLESKNNNVSSSLYARDIIEKIAKKVKYDLIILDDEIGELSALDVLNELKKNTRFSIPVIIMLDDQKEFIRIHYLKDGFADVILKSKLTSELERILKSEY